MSLEMKTYENEKDHPLYGKIEKEDSEAMKDILKWHAGKAMEALGPQK